MAVQHNHDLIDSDLHFSVDTTNRTITNASKKVALMQFDHNSERFSFDISRYIEGHDVLNCDGIHIHYCNTSSATREKYLGLYRVDDLKVDPTDENKATFTWLVSQNATQNVGTLNFLVTFTCSEEDETVYRWSTSLYNSIAILSGMNNGDEIVEEYPDVFSQLEGEIEELLLNSTEQLEALGAKVDNQITAMNESYAGFRQETDDHIDERFSTFETTAKEHLDTIIDKVVVDPIDFAFATPDEVAIMFYREVEFDENGRIVTATEDDIAKMFGSSGSTENPGDSGIHGTATSDDIESLFGSDSN